MGRASELEALWPCNKSGKRHFLGSQSLGSSWGGSAGFTLGQVLGESARNSQLHCSLYLQLGPTPPFLMSKLVRIFFFFNIFSGLFLPKSEEKRNFTSYWFFPPRVFLRSKRGSGFRPSFKVGKCSQKFPPPPIILLLLVNLACL